MRSLGGTQNLTGTDDSTDNRRVRHRIAIAGLTLAPCRSDAGRY